MIFMTMIIMITTLTESQFYQIVSGQLKVSLSEGGDPEGLVKKKKTKRMRTTFTEEQIQILQVA